MRKLVCKYILTFLIIFLSTSSKGQVLKTNGVAEGHSIIEKFNEFFDGEIMKQGVKGNWIFKLNEITGIHKFDYNNDGYIESFFEFNAVPEEGGGVTYYFGVLFKNIRNEGHEFIDFIKFDGLSFTKYEEERFYFLIEDTSKKSMNESIFQIKSDRFEQIQ